MKFLQDIHPEWLCMHEFPYVHKYILINLRQPILTPFKKNQGY